MGRYDHEDDESFEYSEYDLSPMAHLSEDQKIELWRIDEFKRLGFEGEDVAKLLEWDVSPADARRLMEREGERTGCTCRQALLILAPLPV